MGAVSRRIEIDAGHRVARHNGQCANLHGHRYAFELTVDGEPADDGMVIDFGILKEVLIRHVHNPWDHAFLTHDQDATVLAMFADHPEFKLAVLPHPPTAEHLAQLTLDAVTPDLLAAGVTPLRVTVWETPNCSATAENWGALA